MDNKELIKQFFQNIFDKFEENYKEKYNSEKIPCPIIGSYVIDNSNISSNNIIEILEKIDNAHKTQLYYPFRSHKIFAPDNVKMFDINFKKNSIKFNCNINNSKYDFIIKNCKYYYFGENNEYIFLKFEGAPTISYAHLLNALGTYRANPKARIEKLKDPDKSKNLNDDTLLFYHAENNHIKHYSKQEIIEEKSESKKKSESKEKSERTNEEDSDSEDFVLSNSEGSDREDSDSENFLLSDSEDSENKTFTKGGKNKKNFKKFLVNDISNHEIIAQIFGLSLNDYLEKKKKYYDKHANLKHITDKIKECKEKECSPKSNINCINCLTNDIFIPFDYINKELYEKFKKNKGGSSNKIKKHKTKKHKTKKHKTKMYKTKKHKHKKYNTRKN